MRTKLLYTTTLLITTISLSVFSQNKLDFMGFPSEGISQESNFYNNKSTQALENLRTLKTFPSPTSLPSGIAYDGQFLWVCGYNEYAIYKISTVDGSIINTVPVNLQRPYGITYSNDTIYMIDNTTKNIFAFDPLTGSCLDTIIVNHNLIYPTGLYKLNNDFIFNDTKGPQPSTLGDSTYFYNNLTNNINGNGTFGTYATGITYDGQYLWINDNPTQSTMKIDPQTWTLQASYKIPGGMYPNGITWDGQSLWEINNASDSIYMLDPGSVTLINNNLSENKLTIFPNPVNSNENFNILSNNIIPENIYIIDENGKLLANKQVKANSALVTLNANELKLSSGVYSVNVVGKNKNVTSTLVVK